MNTLGTFLTVILFSGISYPQKGKVRKGNILSEGTAIAKIEKEGYRALSPICSFYTAEEVIGSYLGCNPNFHFQDEWLGKNELFLIQLTF